MLAAPGWRAIRFRNGEAMGSLAGLLETDEPDMKGAEPQVRSTRLRAAP